MNAKKLFLIFLSMMGLSATGAVAGGGYVEYGPSGQMPVLSLIDSATAAQPYDCYVSAGAYYHGIMQSLWTVDKNNALTYVKTTLPYSYKSSLAIPGNTINCTYTVTSQTLTTNTSTSKIGTASGVYTCKSNDYMNNPQTSSGRMSYAFEYTSKVGYARTTETGDPVTVNGIVHQCIIVARAITAPIQNGF